MKEMVSKGFMRRAKVLAIAAVVGVAGLMVCTGPGFAADEVFATINGAVITRVQFLDTLEAKYGGEVLGDFITETLIRQAAVKNRVVVLPDRIEAEVARVKGQFQTEAEFNKALAQNRLTLDGFREQTQFRLILEQLGAPDAPTSEQLQEYFLDNRARYDVQDEVNVRHILVKTDSEAAAIVARLANGDDFAALAKEASQDPGSKDNGGEVGYARRGQLVKEFEDVAFALKPGETSRAVKTEYGYHIMRFIDHRLPQEVDYDSVRDRVVADYKQDFSLKSEDVLQALRKEAVITINSDRYRSAESIAAAPQPAADAPTQTPASVPAEPVTP